jgi:hypothetical protein
LVSTVNSSSASFLRARPRSNTITLSNFDPDIVVEGDVTCLQVVGNIATIAGIVTNVRHPQGIG